jgi:hypothetical protein
MTTDRAQRIYPNTARVFAAVIHHDATSRDLAAELHLSVSAVDRIIEFWRSCGLIHIGARKRGAQGPGPQCGVRARATMHQSSNRYHTPRSRANGGNVAAIRIGRASCANRPDRSPRR